MAKRSKPAERSEVKPERGVWFEVGLHHGKPVLIVTLHNPVITPVPVNGREELCPRGMLNDPAAIAGLTEMLVDFCFEAGIFQSVGGAYFDTLEQQ